MKKQTNGIDTYYEVHGKEGLPWLVLSHSLACTARMWDEQIAAFKDHYRILAYDTRGHGQTEAPAALYTLEQLADDLKRCSMGCGSRAHTIAGCRWAE
jgi:3-oxoadipate enol-lactonase